MLQARTSETKPRSNLAKTIQVSQPDHQLQPCLGLTTTQGWASALGYESAPTPGSTRGLMGWADLHHTYGNQAVLRTFRSRLTPGAVGGLSRRQAVVQSQGVSPRLQTKLTVSNPGDQYEQEADRVAEQVMRMPDPFLQRKCACEGSTRDSGQFAEKHDVMRLAKTPGEAPEAPPIVNEVLRQPGVPLDTRTRAFFEPRFGHDLSRVRVHTNAEAAKSARSVNAFAYSVGHDIVFDAGHFAPGKESGHKLLAHELAHVFQQGENFIRRKPAELIDNFSFIGNVVQGGLNATLKARLENVERDLKAQYDATPDSNPNKVNFGGGKKTFKDWVGIYSARSWRHNPGDMSKHASGSAVDVNYDLQPYIATRTTEAGKTI